MKEILLIGGGGHCKSCIDVIECEGKYKIAGIIDDHLHTIQIKEVMGYPVLGGDKSLSELRKYYSYALITIGQIKTALPRVRLYLRLKNLHYTLPIIISPLAYIARHVEIKEGSIIMHHALLNTEVKIGKMCIINTKALIEHESIIGDFCHISTGAIINGKCNIEDEVFIGSNTPIKHTEKISKKSVIFRDIFKNGV